MSLLMSTRSKLHSKSTKNLTIVFATSKDDNDHPTENSLTVTAYLVTGTCRGNAICTKGRCKTLNLTGGGGGVGGEGTLGLHVCGRVLNLNKYASVFCLHWSVVVGPITTQPILATTQPILTTTPPTSTTTNK